jgi:hypothetical protein
MTLYKYHRINLNLLKSLQKKCNWYSRIKDLNDPYEMFFKDNTESDIYNDLIKTFCVCSFSKNRNEILMWSHYADNHKGICLEWEVTGDWEHALIEIEYFDDITIIDSIKRSNSGHLSLNVNTNAKFLKQKFSNWKYEDEVRVIRIEDDLNKKGIYGEYPGELSAIYFGKNSSEEDIELVKLNSNHIKDLKYYKVDLDIESMKIEIINKL